MIKNKLYSTSLSILLMLLLSGISPAQVNGKESSTGSQAIAGSWYFTVTSQTFPVPFRGLVTFDEGGGVVASAQGDVLLQAPPGTPPIATAAHGAWVRTSNRAFLFTFRQIFYNADGSYAGGAKIRNAGTIGLTGNNISGSLVVEYYDANDQVVFTGSGTFTGTRIVAEALNP